MLANKNDQVFPVSLAEIAFTLVFILMLLLGYINMEERQAKEAAQAQLAKTHQVQNAEAALAAMQQAQQQFTQALANGGVTNPAELVQTVVNAGAAAAERERLEREVVDLTKRLVAVEDIRGKIEQAGKIQDDQITREQVENALELKNEIEKLVNQGVPASATGQLKASAQPEETSQTIGRVRQAIAATIELRKQAKEKLGIDVKAGEEPKVVREVVEGARLAAAASSGVDSPAVLRAEGQKLRTQVAFYEKRDKLRGLDHPPCWMDKELRIEYIFNVQTTPEGFVVTRGWPADRGDDAAGTQGLETIMAKSGSPRTAAQFAQGAKPYLDFGKTQSPECRHFVYLSSTIAEADRRDDARRLVSSFFYILERKSPVAL